MKLFDAHCHLQDSRIFSDAEDIIINAKVKHIIKIAIKSTAEQDWQRVGKLSRDFDSLNPSFGLHPWFLSLRSEKWKDELREYLLSYPEAGIGEIGIDPNTKGDLALK